LCARRLVQASCRSRVEVRPTEKSNRCRSFIISSDGKCGPQAGFPSTRPTPYLAIMLERTRRADGGRETGACFCGPLGESMATRVASGIDGATAHAGAIEHRMFDRGSGANVSSRSRPLVSAIQLFKAKAKGLFAECKLESSAVSEGLSAVTAARGVLHG
jgi:hypothetical protein